MLQIFKTPESQRQMGESLWELDPDMAVAWIARAHLEDNGGKDDFDAAHAAWKASEPRAVDFMPLSDALPLLKRRDDALAAIRARWEAMWTPSRG